MVVVAGQDVTPTSGGVPISRTPRGSQRAGTLPGWIVAVLRSALGYSVPRLALAGAAVPAVPVNGLVQTIGVPLRGRPSKPVVVS